MNTNTTRAQDQERFAMIAVRTHEAVVPPGPEGLVIQCRPGTGTECLFIQHENGQPIAQVNISHIRHERIIIDVIPTERYVTRRAIIDPCGPKRRDATIADLVSVDLYTGQTRED